MVALKQYEPVLMQMEPIHPNMESSRKLVSFASEPMPSLEHLERSWTEQDV